MNRMSVTRLVKLPTVVLCDLYTSPHKERKPLGLLPAIAQIPRNTRRLLAMSKLVVHEGINFYVTFDEVVLDGNKAYCYIYRGALAKAKKAHIFKSQVAVGLLGVLFEKSDKRLRTVRVLLQHGFNHQEVDLSGYECHYRVAYDTRTYEVTANAKRYLDWAVAKMHAADFLCTAEVFDKYHPITILKAATRGELK